MSNKCPRVLLIGNGRFGCHHKRILEKYHQQKIIELVAVVTKRTGPKLTPQLLKSIDLVDIVTPLGTHFNLVKKCLPYCDVIVEKPLAENGKKARELNSLAKKHRRLLMVGHIYRFHPITLKLKKLLKNVDPKNCYVSGEFISPEDS